MKDWRLMRSSANDSSRFDCQGVLAPGFAILAIAIALVALRSPLIAIGGFLAIGALVLTRKRPDLVLMLILAAAPFQRDLGQTDRDIVGGASAGVAFSIAELLFAATLPAFLLNSLVQMRRVHLGPIAVPVLLYFSICVASSVLNWRGSSTFVSLGQIFLYLVLAVMSYASFPRKQEDLRLILTGLVCVGTFLAACTLVGQFGALGLNKNGAGASIASALLVCTELVFQAKTRKTRVRLGACLGLMAAALVLTLSRGAWLGAAAGLIVILCLRRQFVLLIRAGTAMALLMAIAWQFLPADKKDYAFDFNSNRFSVHARYESIDLARKYFESSPIIGVGVGLRKQVDATNVFWFTLAETGIAGLMTFGLIHVVLFGMIWMTHLKVNRSDIRFSLLVLGGALVLSKLTHGMVDHYWSRGHLLVAWAAAGMATGAYYSVRAETGQTMDLPPVPPKEDVTATARRPPGRNDRKPAAS